MSTGHLNLNLNKECLFPGFNSEKKSAGAKSAFLFIFRFPVFVMQKSEASNFG